MQALQGWAGARVECSMLESIIRSIRAAPSFAATSFFPLLSESESADWRLASQCSLAVSLLRPLDFRCTRWTGGTGPAADLVASEG